MFSDSLSFRVSSMVFNGFFNYSTMVSDRTPIFSLLNVRSQNRRVYKGIWRSHCFFQIIFMNQFNNPLVIPPSLTNPFNQQQRQQQTIPQTITIPIQEYNNLQEVLRFADLIKDLTVLSSPKFQHGVKVIMKITNQDHKYLKQQTFRMPTPQNPSFQTITFNNIGNSGINYEFSFETF